MIKRIKYKGAGMLPAFSSVLAPFFCSCAAVHWVRSYDDFVLFWQFYAVWRKESPVQEWNLDESVREVIF